MTCPVCHKPCEAAEINAYYKCENCFVGVPNTCHKTIPASVRQIRTGQAMFHPCGGGARRMIGRRGHDN